LFFFRLFLGRERRRGFVQQRLEVDDGAGAVRPRAFRFIGDRRERRAHLAGDDDDGV
jgi:hypothetical protein